MIVAGPKTKASSRVRAFWLAEGLKKHSIESDLIYPRSALKFLELCFTFWKYQLIFFQKSYSRYDYYFMRLARTMGKSTVLDIDDAPSKNHDKRTLKYFGKMAQKATMIFAGSEVLLNLVGKYQSNSYLIPSSILLSQYSISKVDEHEYVCIGWIGNGAHYKEDLIEILYPALLEIKTKKKVKLKIVGASGEIEIFNTFSKLSQIELEIVDQIDWSDPTKVQAEISSFDIGVYPLLDNEFNGYKCGFKALEYMALNIPVVSSNIAINSTIIDSGITGYIASSTDEWVEALQNLIEHKELRNRFGQEGRRKVVNEYSMEVTALKVKNIFFNEL